MASAAERVNSSRYVALAGFDEGASAREAAFA